MKYCKNNSGTLKGGFTLLEVLATCVILAFIFAMTLTMASQTMQITGRGRGSVAIFQEARTAMETLERVLSEAVLNSYWDYDSLTNPKHYLRASELHFVLGQSSDITALSNTVGNAVFCQVPTGHSEDFGLKNKGGFLNSVGFYTRFSASPDVPELLDEMGDATKAWRLWMLMEPSEKMSVYTTYSGQPQKASDFAWLRTPLGTTQNSSVLANNVILLLVRAGFTNAAGEWIESYLYDSRGVKETTEFPQAAEIHQLPPTLSVTLVAIDTQTADALLQKSGGEPYHLMPEGEELFSDAANYDEDIKALQSHLDSRPYGDVPIRYRVFETTVNVANSRWSL